MTLFDEYKKEFGFSSDNPGISYFDYAATSLTPKSVLESYSYYSNNVGVSINRGSTQTHKKANLIFHNALENIVNFFSAEREYKLLFGKNTTELINLMAYSVEHKIMPLDYILIGPYEHHSNYLPWKHLANRANAIFVEIPVMADGNPDYEYIDKIAPFIKVISISAVSNTNGFVANINRLLEKVSEDALVMLDAAQVVAHDRLILHDKISCVFLSSHKMYGLKSISGALVKNAFLQCLRPVLLGGGMIDSIGLTDIWMPDEKKFTAGTLDVAAAVAWSTACNFIKNIGYDEISMKEKYIYDEVYKKLNSIERVKIIEQRGNSAFSLISFVHDDIHAHDVSDFFDRRNIIIRSGNLCSQNSLRRYGYNALSRISFGIGVTSRCLDKLLDAIDALDKFAERPVRQQKRKILVPDEVLVKDGVACGDSVNLLGEINSGMIEFNITVEGCSQAKLTAHFLNEKYNGHDINKTIDACELYRDVPDDFKLLLSRIYDIDVATMRFDCIFSIIDVFLSFVKSLQGAKIGVYDNDDTSQNLACDACVSMSRINWGNRETTTIAPFRRNDTALSETRQSEWMKCGKLCLSDDDIVLLKSLYFSAKDDDFDYLRRNKLDQIIIDHLKNHDLFNGDYRWGKTLFAKHRKEVIKHEVQLIKEFISTQNISASFIKGAINQNLYSSEGYDRVFMDYDILASSADEAFEIGHFLFSRNFLILYGMFSLKEIVVNDKLEYTGHFHVKKFFDYQYQLIIDISFPAYPLGRIGLFYPRFYNNMISHEEQFIVTLCHLFKHDGVYMKDVNDLYLMIKKLDLSYKSLNSLITEYKLEFFSSIALSFIFENYDISLKVKEEILQHLEIKKIEEFDEWPYTKDSAYRVKEYDYKKRLQISIDKQRIYLYPLVIFKETFEFKEHYMNTLEINGFIPDSLCKGIYSIKVEGIRFLLTVMGLFIDNTSDIAQLGREKIRRFAELLLLVCDIDDFQDVPYLTNDWYY
jgi:cysteine desulfurase/selenocysteine lyase